MVSPLPGDASTGASRKAASPASVLVALAAVGWFAMAAAGSVRAAESAPDVRSVQRRTFDFFWRESHPETGLTKDREKNADGPGAGKATVASIASTGYMLAALPIGAEHGWVAKEDAYGRALTALTFVHDRLPRFHGFYYHFVDWRTGESVWDCELSSIDTALLVMGALTAGEYWHDTKVHRLAEEIAGRVEWRWMQTDGGAKPNETAPSMGWFPDKGFIAARWQGYSECAFLYLLAMGTPGEHGLTAAAWDGWKVSPVRLEGHDVFKGAVPIFWAQMTAGYFDLRNQRDRQGRDWWSAWRNAHLADQAYCARHPENKTYAAGFWALNASDQPDGYGDDIPEDGHNTGTVSPTGMLAGMLFTPEAARRALDTLWMQHDRIWGRYGYANAFNIERDWYDTDVLGIDLGMMLLATENARTGRIWRLVGRSPFAKRGLAAAGFHRVLGIDPRRGPGYNLACLRPECLGRGSEAACAR